MEYFIGQFPNQRILLLKGQQIHDVHHLPPSIKTKTEVPINYLEIKNRKVDTNLSLKLRLHIKPENISYLLEVISNRILDSGEQLTYKSLSKKLMLTAPELIFRPCGGKNKGKYCYIDAGQVKPILLSLPDEKIISNNTLVSCEHNDCPSATDEDMSKLDIALSQFSCNSDKTDSQNDAPETEKITEETILTHSGSCCIHNRTDEQLLDYKVVSDYTFFDNPHNVSENLDFRRADGSGFYDPEAAKFIIQNSNARIKMQLEGRCQLCRDCSLCKLSMQLESKSGAVSYTHLTLPTKA